MAALYYGSCRLQKKNLEWTKARRHSFIVSALRAGTQRYPPKYLTLNEAKTEKKVNTKTNRIAQHFLCAECQNDFPSKEVQVDHKIPVIGKEGFTTWDAYIESLFCGKENLQVLCTDCHDIKTKREREERKNERSK